MLLVGGRDLAPFTTQMENPGHHPHHAASGESTSLSESEPRRLCQAARTLPRPGVSAGPGPKVADSPETNWENWISISHPVFCPSRVITLGREVCSVILPPQGTDKGSPAQQEQLQ